MNIGLVTTWFERGAAYVSKAYLNSLKTDNNVFIYARGGEKYAKKDPNWDKDYVTWGKRVGMGTEISIKDISKWIIKNSLDIVFFNEQNYILPVYQIKLKFPDLVLGSYIDYYKLSTVKNFEIFDFLICNTRRHYEVFSWHPQSFYIKWGTNIELFNPSKKIKNKTPVFFHSQGMSHRKGTEILINTFIDYELYKKSKLIIHTQNNLKSIQGIKYNNLENYNITVINKTIPAPGLYYLGDVYVYPTKLEGIGLTIMEALASGLPVIVTDEQPMTEFIDEKICKKVKVKKYISREDGYYWPLSLVDEEDLAEKMNFYIKNYDKIDFYSKNARIYALENLDWKENAKNISKIFKKVEVINNIKEKEIKNYIKKQKQKELKHFSYYLFKKLLPPSIKDIIISHYKKRKY